MGSGQRVSFLEPSPSGAYLVILPGRRQFACLLVRRAKLGFVSRRQIPAPEALPRHRVPRVAS
jgi:hypothetical protein